MGLEWKGGVCIPCDHVLIALPLTWNLYATLCAAVRLSGGGFGAVNGLSAVDSTISGSCRLTSEARSSAFSGMVGIYGNVLIWGITQVNLEANCSNALDVYVQFMRHPDDSGPRGELLWSFCSSHMTSDGVPRSEHSYSARPRSPILQSIYSLLSSKEIQDISIPFDWMF